MDDAKPTAWQRDRVCDSAGLATGLSTIQFTLFSSSLLRIGAVRLELANWISRARTAATLGPADRTTRTSIGPPHFAPGLLF